MNSVSGKSLAPTSLQQFLQFNHKRQRNQKPGKGSEQNFLHRRRADGRQAQEEMPNIVSHPEMQIKSSVGRHPPPTTVAQIRKSSIGKDSTLRGVVRHRAVPHPLGRGTCTGPRGLGVRTLTRAMYAGAQSSTVHKSHEVEATSHGQGGWVNKCALDTQQSIVQS